MPFFDPIRIGSSGTADTAYTVDRSLRFNSADDAYLTRTPSSTGNQKVWTWSAWFKRTNLGTTGYLFASNESNSSGDGIAALYFQSDQIYTYYDTSGSNTYGAVNSRKYRDIGAWYHIVWQVDAANTTHRIWINGVEETGLSNNPIDYNYTMNQSGHTNVMGATPWNTSNTSDLYLAEVHFSDGNKYAASDFGETDATTGQWVPKSVSITYGTNGFYLNFSDNSGTSATTLGKDSSGNSNNWTPNNFSVAAGAGNDSVEDTPTNNFCTLNPLDKNSNVTASDGNLKAVGTSGAHYPIFSTFGMKGGKWYVEYRNNGSSSNWRHAIMNFEHDSASLNADSTVASNTSAVNKVGYGINVNNGNKMHDSDTGSSYGTALSGTSDVLQCAVDLDNGKIYWGINNTWFNSGDPAAGSNPAFSGIDTTITWTFAHHIYHIANCTVNFGQQGFSYTPPSGFKALSSANLTDPTILLPNKHFDTLLFTANASTQVVTGLDFQPDWVWGKSRDDAYDHELYDSVRGATKRLKSNQTDQELTNAQNLQSFNSNGFTLGSATNMNYNSGSDIVAWNWNAGDTDGKTYTVTVVDDSGNKFRFDGYGTSAVTLDLAEGGTYIFNYPSGHPFRFSTTSDGTHGGGSEYTTGVTHNSSTQVTIVVAASAPQLFYYCSSHSGMGGAINTNSTSGSSNFDGAIQTTVKVNASAGFSIATYTGTESNTTFGHGLGVAPQAAFFKRRNSSGNWMVYHASMGNTHNTYLNTSDTSQDDSHAFNDTSPTSSVFTLGISGFLNANGGTYVAYLFSEVAGYSKFGSYTGNGSSDGTFVFLGFRPAWVMVKRSDGTADWNIFDEVRSPSNVVDDHIVANANSTEYTSSSTLKIDFTSNGFKLRGTWQGMNGSGNAITYYAFAESPFKNARAR